MQRQIVTRCYFFEILRDSSNGNFAVLLVVMVAKKMFQRLVVPCCSNSMVVRTGEEFSRHSVYFLFVIIIKNGITLLSKQYYVRSYLYQGGKVVERAEKALNS